MQTISYARHRFPPEIIQYAAWLYFRFLLSFRDVEDLLAERGIDTGVRPAEAPSNIFDEYLGRRFWVIETPLLFKPPNLSPGR